MASTAEILEKEALGEPQIFLYKEGVFWKAYQQSAYRVLQRKPDLKLKKKFIKAVSREVISLGFPKETLECIFRKEEIEYTTEKMIGIPGDAIDMQAYQQWFESVPPAEQPVNAVTLHRKAVNVGLPDIVLKKIREFPVEQSTPMDCMVFLARMRKELTDHGHI